MIQFNKLRYKNFLSSGNTFLEIDLSKSPTTLVIGSNGSGKSTMLCALCYVLFNKSFRKVKNPLLINSINEKNMCVEVEFEIGKKKYLVKRGMKPKIFEIYIDGKMIDQDASAKDTQKMLEQNILKLNFKSFTQVVILGSRNFIPFMQLTPADRRIIIEDLLDIQVFSSMNMMLRESKSILKTELNDCVSELHSLNDKIDIHKNHLTTLKSKTQEAIDNNVAEIDKSQVVVKEYSDAIDTIQTNIKRMMDTVTDKTNTKIKLGKLNSIKSTVQSKIQKFNTDITFFTDNADCPKCKQPITGEFADKVLNEKKTKQAELKTGQAKLLKELESVSDRVDEINTVLVKVMDAESTMQGFNNKISVLNGVISKIQKDILNKTTNDDGADIVKEIAELESKQFGVDAKQSELNDDTILYDIASKLLHDSGIKAKIITQYLPVINKLINNYLKQMDFFVLFELDGNFNESIKSRHRDIFTYNSFSEGQKARIDIALLLTWRKIAKMKNSTNTNLLILDEVFDGSLDAFGVDELTKLLQEGDDNNIFIISHQRDALQNKFKKTLEFKIKNGFSVIS